MPRPFTVRTFLIVLAFVLVDLAGHVVGPALRYPDPSPLLAHPSLMKAVAFALLVLAFSLAALTLLRLEPGLPEVRGARRGLRFGLAMSASWLVGGLEMPLLTGCAFGQELYTAAVDSAALLMLLVTVGATGGRRAASRPAGGRGAVAWPFALVVVANGLGRGAALLLQRIPGTAERPVALAATSAAWCLCMGALYLALRPGLGEGGPWRRAGRATLAFGASYLAFCAFLPVFARIQPAEFLARIAAEVGCFAAGVVASERWTASVTAVRRGAGAPAPV